MKLLYFLAFKILEKKNQKKRNTKTNKIAKTPE